MDCSCDDVTQAEAYTHTLLAFFQAYSELSTNDFYLAGESYFGQYGPNIAHFILNNEGFESINLAGLLEGNGCWGEVISDSFQCNSPNSDRNDADNLYGKASSRRGSTKPFTRPAATTATTSRRPRARSARWPGRSSKRRSGPSASTTSTTTARSPLDTCRVPRRT